jgi:CheY-like chemotaxis protein
MLCGMRQPQVLVVDPNPATLSRVQSALEGSAFAVLSARDAVEAEDRAAGQELALVLSSTGLPRGNGYDLARTLLAHHPAAKVFLMSGGFEVYNRARADQAGVTGRISKPFSADGLRTRLEAVLGPLINASAALVDDDRLSGLEIDMMEPLQQTDERELPVRSDYTPPLEGERVATIIPRDFKQTPANGASVEALEPAVEAAVLEVLPEVVEAVLRRTLQSSSAFRDLVEVAVDEAVRAHLPAIARRVIRERIAEIEAYDD